MRNLNPTSAPCSASFTEKIDQVNQNGDRNSRKRVLDLVMSEVSILRRQYHRVEARLAFLDTWVQRQRASLNAEDKTDESPAGEQTQNQDRGYFNEHDTYEGLLANAVFCVTQGTQGRRLRFRQLYGLTPRTVLSIGI